MFFELGFLNLEIVARQLEPGKSSMTQVLRIMFLISSLILQRFYVVRNKLLCKAVPEQEDSSPFLALKFKDDLSTISGCMKIHELAEVR